MVREPIKIPTWELIFQSPLYLMEPQTTNSPKAIEGGKMGGIDFNSEVDGN